MASRLKSAFSLILIILLLLTIFLIGLVTPPEVNAGPLAGFTPNPPNPPNPPDPPDPPDNNSSKSSNSTEPTDFVYVQIDHCNLSCFISFNQQQDKPQFELVASVANDPIYDSLWVPINKTASTIETLAPVQLIHQGSGFIVEGMLSDQHGTRFPVPYGDQWEVRLTGLPHWNTATSMDSAKTNMDQLQAQLANGPISLGLVVANTIEPQLVKCPLACVVEAAPLSPLYQPETGADQTDVYTLPLLLMLNGLILSLIGALWLFTSPKNETKYRE